MRTALILLLMLALASVVGSLIPQMPNSPEAVAGVPGRPRAGGPVLPSRGALRRVRVVVVRADHEAAVRVARGVPDPAHPRAIRAIRQRPVQARELDAFPLVRRGGRGGPAGSAARRLRRGSSGAAGSGWPRRDVGGRREGCAAGGREPGVPLGVHRAARRRRSVGKGTGYAGRARSCTRARRGSTPRRNYDGRDPHRPVLRRGLHGAAACGSSTTATRSAPGARIPVDGRGGSTCWTDGETGGPTIRGEPSGARRPAPHLPVRVRMGRGGARSDEPADVIAGSEPIELDQGPAPEGVSQLASRGGASLKLPGRPRTAHGHRVRALARRTVVVRRGRRCRGPARC